MELPFHLKTIEPLTGALDIIRFFGITDSPTADADEICDQLNLSERSFSKAIRRLVTKGYILMDGDMVYRLTDQGQSALEELKEYDEASGGSSISAAAPARSYSVEIRHVYRRLVLVMPETLIANQPSDIVIGFDSAEDDQTIDGEVDLVVRLNVVNASPDKPQDTIFQVGNTPTHTTFRITPGSYTQVRVRLQVFQVGENPDEIEVAGGMFVDANVIDDSEQTFPQVAFGSNIRIAL